MAKANTKGGKSSASIRRGGKVTTFGRARAATGKGGSKGGKGGGGGGAGGGGAGGGR